MNLERATKGGAIRDNVKEIAAHASIPEGLAIYRGIVGCPCGTPVLLHIETIWRNHEPTVLRATISGDCCPDCGSVLSPESVVYAGIYSPGWPIVPATFISTADIYHAMTLREAIRRDVGRANSSSADSFSRKHEIETRDSMNAKQPNVMSSSKEAVLAFGEAIQDNIPTSRGASSCIRL